MLATTEFLERCFVDFDYGYICYNGSIPDQFFLDHLEYSRRHASLLMNRGAKLKDAIFNGFFDQQAYELLFMSEVNPNLFRRFEEKITRPNMVTYCERGICTDSCLQLFKSKFGKLPLVSLLKNGRNKATIEFMKVELREWDGTPLLSDVNCAFYRMVKRELFQKFDPELFLLTAFYNHQACPEAWLDYPITIEAKIIPVGEYRKESYLATKMTEPIDFFETNCRYVDVKRLMKEWPSLTVAERAFIGRCRSFEANLALDQEYRERIALLYSLYQLATDPIVIAVLDVLISNFFV